MIEGRVNKTNKQTKIEVNTLNINRESSPLELGQIELLNPGSMTYKTN